MERQKQVEYHERKLATKIVELADQCRADVRACLKKAGIKLDDVRQAEIGVLIGHAIRESSLTSRSFERWVVGRPQPSPPRVIVSPAATTTIDPAYNDDATTEKMPPRER